jgi:hypothetical protein
MGGFFSSVNDRGSPGSDEVSKNIEKDHQLAKQFNNGKQNESAADFRS